MSAKKQPIYDWNADTHTASCLITYHGQEFLGEAKCAPDDFDMENSYTGQAIAEMRACLKVLQYQKNCEIKPELKALKQLYFTMKHSTHFNPNSYEAKALYRQIDSHVNELCDVRQQINNIKISLKEYIELKDAFYKEIRKMRDETTTTN